MDEQSRLLLARWQQGDQQAAQILFQRFTERLIALVRTQQLSSKLAARLDPEDVVQSVYRTFFSEARENRYILEHSGDLWRLLVSITLHKLVSQDRFHSADRRSVEREQGPVHLADGSCLSPELVSREPSPEEAVMVLDEVAKLIQGLIPANRPILEMLLRGHDISEIADALNYSYHMVWRVLKKVRTQLATRLREYQEA